MVVRSGGRAAGTDLKPNLWFGNKFPKRNLKIFAGFRRLFAYALFGD